MHVYGLCIGSYYEDEAFEVLVDSVGTAVFTRDEGYYVTKPISPTHIEVYKFLS